MSSHRARYCPLVLTLALFGLGGPLRGDDAPRTGPAATPKTSTVDLPTHAPSPLAATAEPAREGGVELVSVTFDGMLARIAANKTAKLTLVDAWATWCVPCKENFPHVVEMHQKYARKGLAVVSLSLDDRAKPKQVNEAREFLKEKKAVFTNFLLDEEFGDGFDKLNVNAIPAVFLFGPDGKEVKRFTLDDTENQFTYEEVEKVVAALLDGKPIPKSPPAGAPKAQDAKPSEK